MNQPAFASLWTAAATQGTIGIPMVPTRDTLATVAWLVLASCDHPAVEYTPPRASSQRPSPADPIPRAPRLLRLEPVTLSVEPHPFADMKRGELLQLLSHDSKQAGSLSVGRANRGALVNGVQPEPNPRWKVMHPERSWGTRETILSLTGAIARVASDHPSSPQLMLGDISKKRGGYLRPHRSHQSGRDADIGFYYRHGPDWYVPGTRDNLDLTRIWALLKALLGNGNVEYVFLDQSIIDLLKEHIALHDDVAWIDEVFGGGGPGETPLIRHTRGHQTHVHVRFFCERSRETARLTYKLMAQLGKL